MQWQVQYIMQLNYIKYVFIMGYIFSMVIFLTLVQERFFFIQSCLCLCSNRVFQPNFIFSSKFHISSRFYIFDPISYFQANFIFRAVFIFSIQFHIFPILKVNCYFSGSLFLLSRGHLSSRLWHFQVMEILGCSRCFSILY